MKNSINLWEKDCMKKELYLKKLKNVKWGRKSIIGFMLALVAAISVQGPLAFAEQVSLLQVSSDPFTNTTSQHKTEVEPDNFAFGSTIVSAFQVGRFFDGGSSDIGWATSQDEGKTWKHDFLPGITKITNHANQYDRVSDPTVGYDAKHGVWLISSLAITTSGQNVLGAAVIVSRSTDGGLTWEKPVVVHQATGTENLDKDWIVCDNTARSRFYGNCYAEWDDNGNNNLFQMSTSSDGAKTWGAPKTSPDQASVLGGQPLVQPNGTLIVPIEVFRNNFTFAEIGSFISTDGGNTWSNTIEVAPILVFIEPANIRDGASLPSARIDSSGKVYVVWQDCRFEANCTTNDLVMSTSTDGVAWSPVQRIPIDRIGSTVDHIIPGLAVDRSTAGNDAHLALTYYTLPNGNCTTATCQLTVGFISSTNGGKSWSQAHQLAGPINLTWLALTSQGYMVGDYISTAISPGSGQASPTFASANAPSTTLLDEAMFTVPGGVNIGGDVNTISDPLSATSAQSSATTAHTLSRTAF